MQLRFELHDLKANGVLEEACKRYTDSETNLRHARTISVARREPTEVN